MLPVPSSPPPVAPPLENKTPGNKVARITMPSLTTVITPGYFSSNEFYQNAEVAFGSASVISVAGFALSFFSSKSDYVFLTGTCSLLSLSGWWLATQLATLGPLKGHINKLDHQIIQQTAQMANQNALFQQFANDVGQLGLTKEELDKRVQEFRDQFHSSQNLMKKIFEESTSLHQQYAETHKAHEKSVKELIKIVKEIKDPESALRRHKELDTIIDKLVKTQQELALTEGRMHQAAIVLQELEEKHQSILWRYETETKRLESANQRLSQQLEFQHRPPYFNLA